MFLTIRYVLIVESLICRFFPLYMGECLCRWHPSSMVMIPTLLFLFSNLNYFESLYLHPGIPLLWVGDSFFVMDRSRHNRNPPPRNTPTPDLKTSYYDQPTTYVETRPHPTSQPFLSFILGWWLNPSLIVRVPLLRSDPLHVFVCPSGVLYPSFCRKKDRIGVIKRNHGK